MSDSSEAVLNCKLNIEKQRMNKNNQKGRNSLKSENV